MNYHEFVHKVQNETRLDRNQAEKAVVATLKTLGERLTEGEAADLAAQLPGDLKLALQEPQRQQKYTLDDFLRQVAEREGCDRKEALPHAQAVFHTLCEAVSQGEMKDVISQLPKEFQEVFSCKLKTMH